MRPGGEPGPQTGRLDTMNYLVSAAARLGSARPGASGRGPRTGFRATALPALGAGPGGKGLSEWHFLPDPRVLGTAFRWNLRGGATRPGSEVLDPPLALAGAPGGEDCGGS